MIRLPASLASLASLAFLASLASCGAPAVVQETAPHAAPATVSLSPAAFWNASTVYFLLTDRFANADPANDTAAGRRKDGALLRSFEGGDLAGVRQRIDDGYFDSLGVTALWLTPWVEQIHGPVDEGTGRTWGYHGYWTRDWTMVDPAMGTMADLRALVESAHRRGIRVLMDAVLNHTGPVTPADPAWPADWVRTSPQCTYRSYVTTISCTLVRTLPDILTERDEPVELPPALAEKWRREGRLDQEVAELDEFFRRTGYPRAPRYYLIKWLTDWVRELGIDGYRVDTAKHIEEAASAALKREAEQAFADWKRAHPGMVIDNLPFYMMGEVYGYELSHGRSYDFGDRAVSFFDYGYDGLINFGFKREAAGHLDSMFTRYAGSLGTGALRGASVINYISSHDDGGPLDPERRDPRGAGTKLLLSPGGAQIYYGDELARPLRVAGAEGDANLRSLMNWSDLRRGGQTAEVLRHWRVLGRFRRAHPAVGAGEHRRLQESPYVFSRTLETGARSDRVVVAMGLPAGARTITVAGVFADGAELVDEYSGQQGTVRAGSVTLTSPHDIVLLSERPRPAAADPGSALVRVNVSNRAAFDMDIIAISGGATYRMGTVYPGSERQFVLRQGMLATGGIVQLVAQATGASPRPSSVPQRWVSSQLQVSPGSVVDFDIATLLVNSNASVRLR